MISQLSSYALNFSMDSDAPKILPTSDVYSESVVLHDAPPDDNNLRALKARGAKLMV